MLSRLRISAILASFALTGLIPGTANASIGPGTKFVIPRLNMNTRLASNLAYGPVLWWHDKNTFAIAGHDVTPVPGFGAHGPFYNLYTMRPGDLIQLGTKKYHVKYVLTLKPTEMWTLKWKGVVLSGCWPRYSAEFRKVVLAR